MRPSFFVLAWCPPGSVHRGLILYLFFFATIAPPEQGSKACQGGSPCLHIAKAWCQGTVFDGCVASVDGFGSSPARLLRGEHIIITQCNSHCAHLDELKLLADGWGMAYLQSGASAASMKYQIVNTIIICRVLRGAKWFLALYYQTEAPPLFVPMLAMRVSCDNDNVQLLALHGAHTHLCSSNCCRYPN